MSKKSRRPKKKMKHTRRPTPIQRHPPKLPIEKGWMTEHLFQYQGFCFSPGAVEAIMLVQNLFKARLTDIFEATPPKCGTTWLRALVFATMNRTQFEFSTYPLLTTNLQGCFPYLEAFIRENHSISNLEILPCPRLISLYCVTCRDFCD